MIYVNNHNIVIQIGQYDFSKDDLKDNRILSTTPISMISEIDCYKYYLRLKNALQVVMIDGESFPIVLSPSALDLMAHIMCKDMDFNITYKNDNEQSKQIGEEIDKKFNAVNKIYAELKDKRYIIRTDDGLLMPNGELNSLRRLIKNGIANKGHASFDIIFKFCVGDGQ